ncbi:hypothetical protein SDRG_15487 [Saprolegnia diclina VS20]|uniref:Amino acid permease/ SLC12A domain-containing protein n=1 Tax=Saprolegnia diclina (strain VS20) TaxID=1156394 RepID=T0RAV0_SAPDV|nr:hypothetical protein SDRG_15487 [Saprolegnia diclina VS20]EQC26702.1 hypothetical protein SDRG_15487 [Saprolegnia diclina VS20]|eukprot:XP_008619884.1 hypothetical protein SDRG_15487 [Saprolegnia diclina VS20]
MLASIKGATGQVIKVHPQPTAEAAHPEAANAIMCKVNDVAVADVAPRDRATALHVCCHGLVSVMAGQYYGWNAALATGFGPYVASQLVMSVTYVIYMSCAAEICGKIAFSGGTYGLSRVTLGYYCGYMVGFLELLEYTASTAVSVLFIGELFTSDLGWDKRFEPLIWLACYASFVAFYSLPGRIMWNASIGFALLCYAPAVLYIFGSLKFANLRQFGYLLDPVDNTTHVWASGDISSAYFAWLPYTTWAFAGIECLSLVTDMTVQPKTTIPRGILGAVALLFLSNVGMVCLVPSLPPGIAAATTVMYPLNNGLAMAYGISEGVGTWLLLPAHMGMAAGFVLPCGRLIQALADSTLLPPWLGLKNLGHRGLTRAMILSCGFGYVLCILSYFSQDFCSALQNMFLLVGSLCYGAQLLGFILLRTTYKAESNGFKAPFGLTGAVFAMVVYSLLAISIIGGFQNDHGTAGLAALGYCLLLTGYYYYACKDRQTISKDEYASIFRFTIIKFNNLKRKAARRAQRKPRFWHRVVSLLRSSSTLLSTNRVSYINVGVRQGSAPRRPAPPYPATR